MYEIKDNKLWYEGESIDNGKFGFILIVNVDTGDATLYKHGDTKYLDNEIPKLHQLSDAGLMDFVRFTFNQSLPLKQQVNIVEYMLHHSLSPIVKTLAKGLKTQDQFLIKSSFEQMMD